MEVIQKLEQGQLSAEQALTEMKEISDALEKESKSFQGSGLSPKAYDILQILKAFRYETGTEEKESESTQNVSAEDREVLNALKDIAVKIEETYASEVSAPPGFHLRPELRKDLRAIVRRILQPTKLKGWEKELPFKVEEYALKHFIKVV